MAADTDAEHLVESVQSRIGGPGVAFGRRKRAARLEFLCGATPASIKLGELVRAEVRRAHQLATQEADPETAIREIRAQVTKLERYVRSNC